MISLTIVAAVAVVWAVILFRSPDNPDALARIAGCYAAQEQPVIRISSDGRLGFESQSVRVTGYRDKEGIALSPQHRVMIDRQDHNQLQVDTSYPQLLRYDEARQELVIPDFRGGEAMIFRRDASPCTQTDQG